jgi:citrate/tricarballylate utilization protein
MHKLEALAREAEELATGRPAARGTEGGAVKPVKQVIRLQTLTENEAEVNRQMQICNACRYCEGFCAVFPAMTRRLEFGKADVNYLANLCHNCGACYHACQYAPPHDFGVNVPQAMARVRLDTYGEYAWPSAFGKLYRHNGVTLAVALSLGLALFLVVGALANTGSLLRDGLGGNFYAIFPHNTLALLFGAVFAFSAVALGMGVRRFWADVTPGAATARAVAETARHALTLTYLDGGHGDGCNEESDRFTLARRRFHHFTFYGFMLCFASTVVATLYHYLLDLHAPYAITSLPVLLGTVGGLGLLIGTAGLLRLNLRRDPDRTDTKQRPMDRGFICLLFMISLTGLVLLVWRETVAMPLLLAVHLGTVMAFFMTLAYGKFAHGIYRTAALLKFAIEKRQANRLQLGSD